MNQQQVQSVSTLCMQVEAFNYEESVKKLYPERTDIENIQLSQMSLVEFLYLSKRLFSQFVTVLKNRDISLVLPFLYTHSEFGNASIDNQVQNYINSLSQPNFLTAEQTLLWLVGYQLEYGIYHSTNKKIVEAINAPLSSLIDKTQLIQISIENKRKEIETLYTDLQNINTEAKNLAIQKKEEYLRISENLTSSNNQSAQISEILTKSSEQSARLSTILEQQEENKVQADKRLKDIQESYATTSLKLEENIKNVIQQLEDFKKQNEINHGHLEFIEGKREFFEERINYLEELIGREVGVSLFETFKQRKIELHKPVIFWRWAVPTMAIATICWILFLFSQRLEITNINLWWQLFAVNTLKTIPAIFLLLFAINQYRKERNFQEEYAFKSAVALTIDAYAGRISDLVTKDKLIMEAVFSVYKTPIEEKLTGKIKTKAAFDALKTMAETTKDLVKGK